MQFLFIYVAIQVDSSKTNNLELHGVQNLSSGDFLYFIIIFNLDNICIAHYIIYELNYYKLL